MPTIVILFLIGCLLLATVETEVSAQPVSIEVDIKQKHQVWEGSGASGGWWPHYLTDFPEEKRDQLLDYLFTNRGIELDIYRYNIPAGGATEIRDPMRRAPNLYGPDGKIDIQRDPKGLQMLREVYAKGVRKIVAFSNSPPNQMTINGLASGGEKGASNLKPGSERDFSLFLIEVIRQLQKEFPEARFTLSPINEPQWHWGKDGRSQEGCHFEPDQVHSMFRALVEEVEKAKLNIELEGPESGEWKSSQAYVDALLRDEVIAKKLTHIAIHSYWSNQADREKFAPYMFKTYPNHKLVMSEYCQMEHGHNLTIESGLNLANTVYEDMTICNVVSWQWWLAIAPGGYCDGLVYASPKTQAVETTKRLYTFGQFTKFIKPGWQRVEAKSDGKIRPVAFVSPDGKLLTLVMINNEETPTAIKIIPKGWAGESIGAWATSKKNQITPILMPLDAIMLEGKSVTTMQYRIGK